MDANRATGREVMRSVCPRGHNSGRKVGGEQRWNPFRVGITNHLCYCPPIHPPSPPFAQSTCESGRFNSIFNLDDRRITAETLCFSPIQHLSSPISTESPFVRCPLLFKKDIYMSLRSKPRVEQVEHISRHGSKTVIIHRGSRRCSRPSLAGDR